MGREACLGGMVGLKLAAAAVQLPGGRVGQSLKGRRVMLGIAAPCCSTSLMVHSLHRCCLPSNALQAPLWLSPTTPASVPRHPALEPALDQAE